MTSKSKPTPARVAAEIRSVLRRDGSAEHAQGVQWFFKEEIKSHGWYTGELRRLARQYQRSLQKEFGLDFVVRVADSLFSGRVLEEKVFAVLMLERLTANFDDSHFALFESWLDRISSWADHDALVHYLIGPMMAANSARVNKVFQWAKSQNRWHRRAACVAFIQGTRQQKFFSQITRLSNMLLSDEDDMVQKGLGWLLRESAKANPAQTVPYLLKIRKRAPRRILRTACETLGPRDKERILSKRVQ
jgi:3-methyladenine DNA glycosylase AlkD